MTEGAIQMLMNAGYLALAFLLAATVYVIVAPMFEADQLKKRMASVSSARDTLRDDRMKQLNAEKTLRAGDKGLASRWVDRFSLEKLLEASDLKDKMAQAGMRGQGPIYKFYFFRMILPIALGTFGLLFLVIMNTPGWEMLQRLGATLALTLFGYYLPGIYVKNTANKRLASIMAVFPDALDLLLICIESGMSVELAFARVGDEMAENSVELAEELHLTTAELSYLSSRRAAFENLARRNNHVGIRSVATSLIQAERYGTPLGDSLRTMANENRQLRMMAAEKKAASLPAKLTVPMIVFFLPVLFIVILTPAAMRLASALS
ncbi:type II secretion system protein [Algimonas ampicilliniresistens]|jgi:tight adherence protein C|uniref:Type II secretion system protein n=1 Tax=Algimonas ampicilliniresistens TaxID=1298735 RepID=A0ABQ5VEU5_9PROT|nr:type II secretion system F family protein [Algimonas ampicilliniresistens]GLQ24952.1 type II secretion system protein [Algimonas ampicilliniresistens]